MQANSHELVKLTRDCEAVQIPYGNKVTLYAGTEVTITQSLGGAYTVMTHQGMMVSIAGKDADAIGKEVKIDPALANPSPDAETVEKLVWNQLRTCYDPEIPHNIVDLGLIYECTVTPIEEMPDHRKVYVKMTLTAPGCGMGGWLSQDARTKLLTIPTVKEVVVDVVFDPPWNPSKMAPALRREMYG